jgi:hypothetical protein
LPGQFSVAGGGSTVRLAVIWPFLPEAKVPAAITGPNTSCLFAAAGQLPPWFTHWYTAWASALAS